MGWSRRLRWQSDRAPTLWTGGRRYDVAQAVKDRLDRGGHMRGWVCLARDVALGGCVGVGRPVFGVRLHRLELACPHRRPSLLRLEPFVALTWAGATVETDGARQMAALVENPEPSMRRANSAPKWMERA